MSFPFNVYAVGFIAAVFFSAISFPLWRRFCIAVGHVDDPGHRKIHSAPMPLAGGLTVMTGFFLPVVLGATAIFLLRPVEAEGMALGEHAGRDAECYDQHQRNRQQSSFHRVPPSQNSNPIVSLLALL